MALKRDEMDSTTEEHHVTAVPGKVNRPFGVMLREKLTSELKKFRARGGINSSKSVKRRRSRPVPMPSPPVSPATIKPVPMPSPGISKAKPVPMPSPPDSINSKKSVKGKYS